MNVGELIAKLSEMPQDLPVVFYSHTAEDGDKVGEVRLCEGEDDEPYYKGTSPFEPQPTPMHVLITDARWWK